MTNNEEKADVDTFELHVRGVKGEVDGEKRDVDGEQGNAGCKKGDDVCEKGGIDENGDVCDQKEDIDGEKGEDLCEKGSGDEENETGEVKKKIDGRTMYAVVSILAVEMCERLTYYSITANIMLYCTSVLQLTDPQAVKINQIFSGTAMILPLVGGYIADSICGRYNTVLGAAFIYIIGLVLIPASAMDYRGIFGGASEDSSSLDLTAETRLVFYLIGLTCIALGTGGIKSTVGPFGAQQLKPFGEAAVRSFFNWFYWFINFGSTFAFTGVAYVQQNVSFTWGYSVPLLSMCLALLLFVCSRGFYNMAAPGESAIRQVIGVVVEGTRRRGKGHSFFDAARSKNGGSYEDETVTGVLSACKLLLFFLPILGYSICYFQVNSITYLQSLRLDVKVNDFLIPVAALGIFNTVIILVLIPLFDRLLYPYLEKIGSPFTLLKRMGVGMFVAILGIVASGVLEVFRKQQLETTGGVYQRLGGQDFRSSRYSIFTQIPQLVLTGISEVFVLIPALEFSYTHVPFSMQGLMQGSVLALFGVGGYLGTAILSAVNAATSDDPWLSDELNDSHAENLYFLYAGILGVNLFIYIVIALLASPGSRETSTAAREENKDKSLS